MLGSVNQSLQDQAVLTRAVEGVFRKLIRFLVGKISLVMLQQMIRTIFVEEAVLAEASRAPDEQSSSGIGGLIDDDDASVIDGRVHVAAGARIINSTIRGPVSIGADAVIEDSFIGPFSAVGARCRVAQSEVEHSVLMEDAAVVDIPRLEDSLIGSHAEVTRTRRKPRSLRLMIGDHCQVDVE